MTNDVPKEDMAKMRYVILFGSVALAVGAAVACSNDFDDSAVADDDAGTDGGSVVPPGNTTPQNEAPAGTGNYTGLPCDVQAVIENRCIACHDGKTAFAMQSFNDFIRNSTVDPTKTIAQEAVIRMKATDATRMPKPPAAPAEPDEIQAFEDWVNGGTKRNPDSCTDPPPDGGTAGDAGPFFDAGPEAGDGGLQCSSGILWNKGEIKDPEMHPGRACNACHQINGPNTRLAGTVYPTLNEVDDCYGKAPPPTLTVRVTDKTGKVYTMTANKAGNFFLLNQGTPRAPFRAEITDGTKTRKMMGTVTSGDCNSCHTQTGKNNAPGRILIPM